jgi:N-sulfoglucosamine sulfohydrolase
MAAMNEAAKTDPAIAARIALFRYRVPEEFYDLQKDPDCLENLIDNPAHRKTIELLQSRLVEQMKKTQDPMLAAFQHRDDRAAVDKVLVKTYGPRKPPRKRRKKKSKKQ